MSGFVIDASAIGTTELSVEEAHTVHAPELIDLEFANLVRKAVLRGQRSAAEADALMEQWAANDVIRSSHTALLPRIWQLRHTITPHDAAYVALAEALQIPLVTADHRLAAAAAPYCEVLTVSVG